MILHSIHRVISTETPVTSPEVSPSEQQESEDAQSDETSDDETGDVRPFVEDPEAVESDDEPSAL